MTMKTTVGIVLCAAAAALTACGGGDDGGGKLAKADLAKKANAICSKYDKEAKAVKQPTNISDPSKAAPYFRQLHDIGKKQQDELEGLEPADAVKADYEAFTTQEGKIIDLLDKLADAAEAKDAKKGQELFQQAAAASTPAKSAAQKVGTTSCV